MNWMTLRKVVRIGVGIVLSSVIAQPAISQNNSPTKTSVFEILDQNEAQIAHFQDQQRANQSAITQATRRLELQSQDADTARRATQRLQRELASQLGAWERAQRTVEREQHHWPTGHGADTQRLLDRARPHALQSRATEISLLRSVHKDEQHIDTLLLHITKLGVELAQNSANADLKQRERTKIIEQARAPEQRAKARAELELTRQKLDQSLQSAAADSNNKITDDFHRLKGTLITPVTSAPTFGFGPRKQAESMSFIRHTGYTYVIDANTPVRAVAPGIVVLAQTFQGYGKLVILDHGSGYHSIYAHLDEIHADPGKHISRGYTIGKSGQTGSIEGPKLYFELRHQGQAIDPAPWFLRRD